MIWNTPPTTRTAAISSVTAIEEASGGGDQNKSAENQKNAEGENPAPIVFDFLLQVLKILGHFGHGGLRGHDEQGQIVKTTKRVPL
ncbi:hypothetical protein [uncultured Roseibium sp.]|uniref:hypothetical protein n=1 Tax=uncultured Roseibium sp. TaxID=1936171 RepID=UPI003216F2DD